MTGDGGNKLCACFWAECAGSHVNVTMPPLGTLTVLRCKIFCTGIGPGSGNGEFPFLFERFELLVSPIAIILSAGNPFLFGWAS